jgi:hypothetical protein
VPVGGKDSYTLLDILLSLQRSAPVDFELFAVNLDQKQPDFRPRSCLTTCARIGVPFHVIEQDTYSVVKRVIPEGKTMCGPVLAPAARRPVPLRGRETASPRSRSGITGTISSRRCS